MTRIRILADDLTGALDCAAAFGAGVPVHLGEVTGDQRPDIEIVSTGTRDVQRDELPSLLLPSLAWLQTADIAFKKVDSLLRGNTFEEVDWLARQGNFQGVGFVPAFPAQGRLTEGGQQWWVKSEGQRTAVAASITTTLVAKGWTVVSEPMAPDFSANRSHRQLAWVPDVRNENDMLAVATQALNCKAKVLWCASAGLAQALALKLPQSPQLANEQRIENAAFHDGPLMLISASHHAVTQSQWQILRNSITPAGSGEAPDPLEVLNATHLASPCLIDLSASSPLTSEQAANLLAAQTQKIAQTAPRPRTLVVVGGDTLLALCQALGATGLQSAMPMARPGWGCARMLGGRWDGLICHTRSGAFGNPNDLLEMIEALSDQ